MGKFRVAFIKTAIIYGLIISVLTEILSISRSLNFINMALLDLRGLMYNELQI
jgi:hypothetical protein